MGTSKKKRYMLDTSVIMDDVDILKNLHQEGLNRLFISDIVLSEIDKHKTSPNPDLGFAARRFVRLLDDKSFRRARVSGKRDSDKIRIATLVYESGEKVDIHIVVRESYPSSADSNDRKILSVAKDYGLTLLTNDASFKAIALAEGVKAESILKDSVNHPDAIDFVKEIELGDREKIPSPEDLGMKVWEQLVVRRSGGKMEFYVANGTGFIPVPDGDAVEKGNPFGYVVSPANIEQKFYSHILSSNPSVVVVSGSTGSGKTLFAIQEGIKRVKEKRVGGIVYMRYTVNAGDRFSELGYRKGSEEEKLSYYNYPLYGSINFILEKMGKSKNGDDFDKIGKNKNTVEFMGKYNIEVVDIAHARGITISNRFIIFDEVQNAPLSILKLIGTRIGKDSTLVLLGDPKQVDHPYLTPHRNSLVTMLAKAKKDPFVAGIILKSTVRSSTAEWFQKNL